MNLDEQRKEAEAISERLKTLQDTRSADAVKRDLQNLAGCDRESTEENVASAIDSDLHDAHRYLREALKCKEWI